MPNMAGDTLDIGLAHQDDDLWRPGRGDNPGYGDDKIPELHVGQRIRDKDEIDDGEVLDGIERGLTRLLTVGVHRVLFQNGQDPLQSLGIGTDDKDLLPDRARRFVFFLPGDLHERPT